MLPEEKDAADLLRRMQTVATQSNLKIKGFKPSPIVTKQLHAEWPITLELDGTYHNLAIFFDRVGKFTRIVNITGLDVKGEGQAGTELDDHRDVRGDDVRAARQAEHARRSRPARREGGRPDEARASAIGVGACIAACRAAQSVAQAPAPAATPAAATPAAQPAPPPTARPRRRSPIPTPIKPTGAAIRSSACVGTGAAMPRRPRGRARAPPGSAVAEMSVRGIMQSRGALIAMIQGPDNKTYIVHQGDKLARRHDQDHHAAGTRSSSRKSTIRCRS